MIVGSGFGGSVAALRAAEKGYRVGVMESGRRWKDDSHVYATRCMSPRNEENEHDVKSILACFSDDAFVRDEGEEHRGKKRIEGWIVKTIEKYKFQFKPLSLKEDDVEVVVAVEVSGAFDGSPVTLDYHFTIENEQILSLTIK